LESKGLIRKGAPTTGKGKEQGIEYWVTPSPGLAKTASLAFSASQARAASPAESGSGKEYKEETIHEEPTQTQACVGVASRFTLEECRRYANHLQKTGQGITNPGGFAITMHRTGEADALIESFLNPQPERYEISNCPDCKGQGFKVIEKNGREGAVKRRHDPATNRDLKGIISAGQFRQDLYYRISTLQIEVPALRERREDIPLLAEHFLDKFCAQQTPSRQLESTKAQLNCSQATTGPGTCESLKM
jgi:hypothetical protein